MSLSHGFNTWYVGYLSISLGYPADLMAPQPALTSSRTGPETCPEVQHVSWSANAWSSMRAPLEIGTSFNSNLSTSSPASIISPSYLHRHHVSTITISVIYTYRCHMITQILPQLGFTK